MLRPFVIVVASAACTREVPATGDAPESGVGDTSVADVMVDANGPLGTAVDSYFCCENPPPPTIPAVTPQFDPPSGTSSTMAIRVRIASATPGAVIYYTTDGTAPNSSSPKHTDPIDVTRATTIKAMAMAPGLLPSEIAIASYTVAGPGATVEAVVFAPPAGSYSGDQTVTLSSATPTATICYTTDGSAPSCKVDTGVCMLGTTYSAPFVVTPTTAGRVVSAIACKAGAAPASITRATYTLL